MFRIIVKHDIFDLQAVLLMCWINRVDDEASRLAASECLLGS
jgi:hypothetical protein